MPRADDRRREPGRSSPLASLPPLREVIARHGIAARRTLGQHFLLDANLTGRIARAAGDLSAVTVYEVGAGPGGLTRALLARDARRVVAVERDRRCIAALEELAAAARGRLHVVEADALAVDEAGLIEGPAKVVANLPYNISTALLMKWLDRPELFQSYTLMFQKEVAMRILAEPGSRAYGRLTVMVQWLCQVGYCFDVNARAFTPPPKVSSAVIQLTPRAEPAAPANRARLERVLVAAFGKRRKMLRHSLKAVFEDPEGALAVAGVEPTARAETLSIAAFCRLAGLLQ